jgi:tryptophanyl-tRNA synthetase
MVGMSKPTILTGLRANSDLHLGNYFGALLPIVDMAESKAGEYNVNLFVPDLHSFTTPIDYKQLRVQVMNNVKLFAAAGLPLDHPGVHIYRQSYIPAHSELTWILDCFTGFGEMSRMTQFKDKSAGLSDERISVGLFNYPVLMAADILLYDATYVPVGDDQSQHLEYARDIAERLNRTFKADLLTVPKAVSEQNKFFGKDQGLRIKDLTDPTKKMSKSNESEKGVIFLTDTPDTARKKIMGATTDNLAMVKYDPANQPGVSNLIEILALLRGSEARAVADEFASETSYGAFKNIVADEAASFLTGFQDRLNSVDQRSLTTKLESSEEQMRKLAGVTLQRVQTAIGLR